MNLKLTVPTPLDYFSSLVASDRAFPLLEAAASLAQDDYPELSVQNVLNDMDHLLARVIRHLPKDADALTRLKVLNRVMYRDLGFAGNFNNYGDPDNSYLHCVLKTRLGIPVSVAVIWLDLARGLGLEAYGLSFPGHFLVKVLVNEGQVVIDPLSGQSLSQESLVEMLENFVDTVQVQDSLSMRLAPYLQAASPRGILARMLRNLKEIHAAEEDWLRLLAVEDRLLVLLPRAWQEYRDRGMALAEAGFPDRAVRDLDTYLAHAGPAPDRNAIAMRAEQLRRTTH